MGGQPPLGYDIADGRLVVNAEEAERVRTIFGRYLELGSLKALEREGVRSKRWTNRAGEEVGGGLMSPGAIHYLLRAPPYRGVTRHKDKLYPDTHPAVVDEELWSAVQAKLDPVADKQPAEKLRSAGAPLAGLVFDDRDNPMVPLHSKKGVKRYRYYLSRPKLIGRGQPGACTASRLACWRALSPIISLRASPRDGSQISPQWTVAWPR